MMTSRAEKVIKAAIDGNELPFSHFVKDLYQGLVPKLVVLIKDKSDTEAIFIAAMQKFWERFVINQEKLPLNIEAYVFVMCKNAWLLQKQSAWHTKIVLQDSYFEEKDAQVYDMSRPTNNLKTEDLKAKALTKAIEALSPKCKTLIEVDLNPTMKLKDLQATFGYSNYQALVQAKYNCKKRLVKKVYEILATLKADSKN
jgi:DNA-directed RNA polymerase specialized sigma24 family protein